MLNVGQSTSEWGTSNNISVWFEEETTSTNDIAKQNGFKNEDSWMFVTNSQSKGRGRRTNTWTNAKPGDQLLLSWCFKLDLPPQPIASPLFGWAVYKSLNDEFDLNLSIKAPNDIYTNSQKLGGILLESVSQGTKHFICVGLGLNVNSVPEELTIASSIVEEIGADIPKNRWFRFLNALHANLADAAAVCQGKEIPSLYRTEILTALKKWPDNTIISILSNGDLITSNDQKIPWTSL